MDVGDILKRFEGNEVIAAVLPAIEFYIPALARANNQGLEDRFTTLVGQQNWTEVDRMMWTMMREGERDKLSKQVLEQARKKVNQLKSRHQQKDTCFLVLTSHFSPCLPRQANYWQNTYTMS